LAAPAEEAQSFTTYLKSRIPPSAQAPAFPRKKLVPDDDIPAQAWAEPLAWIIHEVSSQKN